MKYTEIGQQIGQLVQQKNEAYGDSFSKSEDILKVLFPNGVQTKPIQRPSGNNTNY